MGCFDSDDRGDDRESPRDSRLARLAVLLALTPFALRCLLRRASSRVTAPFSPSNRTAASSSPTDSLGFASLVPRARPAGTEARRRAPPRFVHTNRRAPSLARPTTGWD
ncbi:hypothetical protein GCM10009000_022790 [Halobacterium noricense]